MKICHIHCILLNCPHNVKSIRNWKREFYEVLFEAFRMFHPLVYKLQTTKKLANM